MATSQLSGHTFRHRHTFFRQCLPASVFLTPPNYIKTKTFKSDRKFKWEIKLSLVDKQSPTKKPTVDMKQLVEFLYEDLPHLFDDQGIDRTAYDDFVKYRDPITKHDSIDGYLFNIAMLKQLFTPNFQLHWAKQVMCSSRGNSLLQNASCKILRAVSLPMSYLLTMETFSIRLTGAYEITTKWTVVMKFILLPWKPELVLTGTSVMGVNPETNKFNSHVDYWDSIKNNDYFSLEGLIDVIKQLRIYKTPDLETPSYQILRRTATYEVRKYDPFIVVETEGDNLAGNSCFNDVAGYIFGKNSATEKIPMTTPVFTQGFDAEKSKVSIQIVLPSDKSLNSLPAPNQEGISLRKTEGGIAAALKFSGKPTDDIVREKEKQLRSSLIKDGLKPQSGCMLARYNDPGRTWKFIMRNEVLIWLQDFKLD